MAQTIYEALKASLGREPSNVEMLAEAWPIHRQSAIEAAKLFREWCAFAIVPAPGMQCPERTAIKMACRGAMTIEEGAASEYLYRWNLALRSPVFGVPHTLGI